jgi:ADP-heptose:LPS heptosyltransferase
VGNGLRLYSPFFNQRVKIHRSRPPLHEADFCLRLLTPLGLTPPSNPCPRLVPPPEAQARADILLRHADLEPGRFLVVHPGGGGSAGRPGPEDFARFARAAREAACPEATLTVSAGPGEEALAQEVAAACGAQLLPASPDVLTFQALLTRACFFLAGSTGPLHLAAASAVPTLGFYPWKASQTATRWAPLGPRARALSPKPDPCQDCIQGRCTSPSCFARISLDEVARLAREAARKETATQEET